MIDFLGIGAQKAGTTWIYHHLSRHPQIRFPAGKEVHFWDCWRANGVEWWTGLFADNAFMPARAIPATIDLEKFLGASARKPIQAIYCPQIEDAIRAL